MNTIRVNSKQYDGLQVWWHHWNLQCSAPANPPTVRYRINHWAKPGWNPVPEDQRGLMSFTNDMAVELCPVLDCTDLWFNIKQLWFIVITSTNHIPYISCNKTDDSYVYCRISFSYFIKCVPFSQLMCNLKIRICLL